MKVILRAMLLVGGLLLVPSHILAEGFDVQPYLGAGIGAFNLDAGAGSDTTVGGFGTFGAGLNENFAVELRFGATSSATTTFAGFLPIDSSVDWFVSYLAKPQIILTGDLNIYALIGGTTMKSTATILGTNFSHTGTGFSYGAGLEYKAGDQVYIGGEWIQYATDADINSPTFPGLDVWGASATIRYKF